VKGIRRYLLFALFALLGAAVAVMPTVAGSEITPSISAYEYGANHYWQPSTATVAPGGTVKFANPYSEKHSLKFTGGPGAPICTGIPEAAGEPIAGSNWHGECTFTAPGTYTFICTVHPTQMTGTITVTAAGTTTVSSNPPPTGTPTGTGSGAPTPGSGEQPQGGAAPASTPFGSPLAGSAANAVHAAYTRRGSLVQGFVNVAAAGVGGRLEVDLLAPRASLARAGAQTQVGRFVRGSLPSGRVPFRVPLSARARRALHSRGHLALTVRIVLTPLLGPPVTVSRTLTVHA
jgi:plastocyanin